MGFNVNGYELQSGLLPNGMSREDFNNKVLQELLQVNKEDLFYIWRLQTGSQGRNQNSLLHEILCRAPVVKLVGMLADMVLQGP